MPLYIGLEVLSACPRTISAREVLHISYTMCTRGFPDIYTLSPRVYISGKPLLPMV